MYVYKLPHLILYRSCVVGSLKLSSFVPSMRITYSCGLYLVGRLFLIDLLTSSSSGGAAEISSIWSPTER